MFCVYQELIWRLSRCNSDLTSYFDQMIRRERNRGGFEKIWYAIKYRKEKLTENDWNRVSAFTTLGYFKEFDLREKAACYCIVMEAEYNRELERLIRDCSPYDGNEPIFNNPEIKDRREKDLIKGLVGERTYGSNIFKLGDKWGYYDHRIPLQIYDWLEDCFKNNAKRIRINPEGLYPYRPPQMMIECLIMPSKWQWWKNLEVYKGTHTGSSYVLLGNDPQQHGDYYDYNALNVRCLQEVVTRRNSGNLSMMLEELLEYKHPTDNNQEYVIGRMIHLDTDAQVGAPFANAVLNHIDLAYNLYIDDEATARLGQELCAGEPVQNATRRTHILRIEDIPFSSIFKIAQSFFKSRTLTDEWIETEFQ